MIFLSSSQAGLSAITVIGAGLGSYLGSYLKKKGENLATHEDVAQLVAQMEATTKATKMIEASISNEVWDRQKQWELKRQAILEGLQAISDFQAGVLLLRSVLENKIKSEGNATESYLKTIMEYENKALEAVMNAQRALSRANLMISLMGGKAASKAFINAENLFGAVAKGLIAKDAVALQNAISILRDGTAALIESIRKDFGIEE